jgi:hypothetical protein
MKLHWYLILGFSLTAFCLSSEAATYPGNGATGFGGPVGTGSISISDSLSGLTLTLNRGAGALNDVLVLYLDTQPGGFNDTSLFTDNGDGGREAISGANNGNPSHTVASFPTGFGADYAMAIESGFIGVFQLVVGLTAGSRQTFFFLGSLISTSAYRANETIGASITMPGDAAGNAGFNNPQTFSQDLAYTVVPEPSVALLMGFGLAVLVIRRRR